jgi:ribosomal protein S18 acetylase RimI-like enzyme
MTQHRGGRRFIASPKIRAAAVTDARGIADIHVRAWRAAYRDLMPQEHLDSLSADAWTTIWQRRLESGTTFVAEISQDIAGFCSVGPSRDEDSDDSTTGEIYAIYVEPELWGHSIGTKLCDAALASLRDGGFDRVSLWVLADNVLGKSFYEKYGFAADGHEEPYRIGGIELAEHRYVMTL